MNVRQEQVTFYSDGLKLAATLFTSQAQAMPRAGIVLCQGNRGVRSYSRFDELGKFLAGDGYMVLSFDQRGFGESEGPRGRYVPWELVEDIHSATAYLLTQLDAEQPRIGLFGSGFGAANAIVAASLDENVGAVVALAPFANGHHWLRSLRRYSEWKDFLSQFAADRVERARSGISKYISMDDLIPPSPSAIEQRKGLGAELDVQERMISLECAERILEFKPEDAIAKLTPRPILIMHAEKNDLVPLEQAQALYEAAEDPKQLIVFSNAFHHEVFRNPLFDEVLGNTQILFREWLPVG